MRRAIDGAAFYAAPDSGSDQHRNGTQDVKTPSVVPRCGLRAVRGSFTSWVPDVGVMKPMNGNRGACSCRRAEGNVAISTRVLGTQNAAPDRRLPGVYRA